MTHTPEPFLQGGWGALCTKKGLPHCPTSIGIVKYLLHRSHPRSLYSTALQQGMKPQDKCPTAETSVIRAIPMWLSPSSQSLQNALGPRSLCSLATAYDDTASMWGSCPAALMRAAAAEFKLVLRWALWARSVEQEKQWQQRLQLYLWGACCALAASSCQGPQGTGQYLNYKAALVSKGREGFFDQI